MSEPTRGGWPRAKEASHPIDKVSAPRDTSRGAPSQASDTAREARRGWATCFPATKTEDWQADFTGCVVLEDGQRYWVNVYKKLDKNRERYVSVHVKPWKARGS
jgi:hypothetical protein